MSFFEAAYDVVVGIEAGYSDDSNDPGNWTGGKAGVGKLLGTKFGISAAAYPMLDIPNITLADSRNLYKRDYWDKCGCDSMSWEMALINFDAAINQGPGFEHSLHGDSIEVMAERGMHYAENVNFKLYGKGWMRRLFTIFKAAQRTPS